MGHWGTPHCFCTSAQGAGTGQTLRLSRTEHTWPSGRVGAWGETHPRHSLRCVGSLGLTDLERRVTRPFWHVFLQPRASWSHRPWQSWGCHLCLGGLGDAKNCWMPQRHLSKGLTLGCGSGQSRSPRLHPLASSPHTSFACPKGIRKDLRVLGEFPGDPLYP